MQSIKQLCAVAAVEIPFAEAPNVVRALGHILCASRWGGLQLLWGTVAGGGVLL